MASRRTNTRFWVLALVVFLVVGTTTNALGAPEAFVRVSQTTRPLFLPTGYGLGMLFVLVGFILLVLAAGIGQHYRMLRRHPPDDNRATGRTTVEGQITPASTALSAPVDGSQAVWYVCEILERQTGGIFAGNWLPVASVERATTCRVSTLQGRDSTIEFGTARLLPTFSDAHVHCTEQTVRPDESLPPGIARLERTIDNSSNNTAARHYREWYITPETPVVANGRLTFDTTGTDRSIGRKAATILLGPERNYRSLCSSLRARTFLAGGSGVLLTAIGLVLVVLSI